MSFVDQQSAREPLVSRPQPWGGILLVWVAVALPFTFLYVISRRAVINEVRQHVMGVAIAAAAGLEEDLLEEIQGPADTNKPAFAHVQRHLARLIENNPDIRFIYTMRRSTEPFAPPHSYMYIVDAPARDFDGDGQIGPDETSEDPGAPYDASEMPAMVEAWDHPAADADVSPDPPYPDSISGYAPIRGPDGNTLAIVGADVTARTVSLKLRVIQVVIISVWLLICILIAMIIHLYYQQRAAFEEIKRLNEELAARHDLLRRTNVQLSALQEAKLESDPAATAPRMVFDRYYLRAAQAGREPSAVFDIDQDHVAFYLASIPGAPAGAIMVSSLVRIALSTLAEGASAAGETTVYVDLHNPAAVLHLLGTLVAKELPAEESVSLAYGVLDLSRNECAIAAAGESLVVLRWQTAGRAEVLEVPSGPPLSVEANGRYQTIPFNVAEEDRIVFADTSTLEPAGRAPRQVGSTLLAAAMQVRTRPLLEQVTQLAAPFPGRVASLLAIEVR